jgi:16S rRNA C1402 (ribose-2'-O) methylase RsmI
MLVARALTAESTKQLLKLFTVSAPTGPSLTMTAFSMASCPHGSVQFRGLLPT